MCGNWADVATGLSVEGLCSIGQECHVVIVIPSVLVDLLEAAEPGRRKAVCLDFGAHVLDVCADSISGDLLRASRGYLDAARRLLAGTGDAGLLARARSDYFGARGDGQDVVDASGVASVSVCAACQREMEGAGMVQSNRYVPRAVDVAKEAQAAVGAYAAHRATAGMQGEVTGNARTAARVARWEEARWQLLRVIEVAPRPAESRQRVTENRA
ncbi:hypothetical protein [Nocardia brevicatena]|uniref:hypothetical protein n=1 Tax=Nocardia brevicatena TaxID=37327 RepID=UPI001C3F24A9|nr:hypothetical protein [Nocardia brevicatena]